MATVTLNIPDEVKAATDAIATAVKDIKAGVGAAQILTDTIPNLIAASAKLSSFSADLKDPQVRGYLAYALEQDVEAAVVKA